MHDIICLILVVYIVFNYYFHLKRNAKPLTAACFQRNNNDVTITYIITYGKNCLIVVPWDKRNFSFILVCLGQNNLILAGQEEKLCSFETSVNHTSMRSGKEISTPLAVGASMESINQSWVLTYCGFTVQHHKLLVSNWLSKPQLGRFSF